MSAPGHHEAAVYLHVPAVGQRWRFAAPAAHTVPHRNHPRTGSRFVHLSLSVTSCAILSRMSLSCFASLANEFHITA